MMWGCGGHGTGGGQERVAREQGRRRPGSPAGTLTAGDAQAQGDLELSVSGCFPRLRSCSQFKYPWLLSLVLKCVL